MAKAKRNKTILVGITASIAAYRSIDLVKELNISGFHVDTVLTKDAEHFITPLALKAMSDGDVYRDMFREKIPDNPCIHIGLAEKADLVVIAPASADFIAKAAVGIADSLLLAILLSTQARVIIAPAMNTAMYKHPATQANINILKKRGVIFSGPRKGRLACDTDDMGHVEDVPTILKVIRKLIK